MCVCVCAAAAVPFMLLETEVKLIDHRKNR